jgi:hypothetical protein
MIANITEGRYGEEDEGTTYPTKILAQVEYAVTA